MILEQRRMPPKFAKETKRLNIVVDVEWVQKINFWRGRQPDVPNLSEAIRLLVDDGLEARAKGDKPKPKKKL